MSDTLVQIGVPAVDPFVHEAMFKTMPSIYAIEATSACNLQCPMCLRSANEIKHPALLSLELLKLMQKRGDFAGSYYIELQMAGEPTIHPKLDYIIKYLRQDVGVMVGLSTHGLNMRKKFASGLGVTDALLGLNALTISVDSLDADTYHKLRFPANLGELKSNLDYFFYHAELRHNRCEPLPFIELQLVKTALAEGSGNIEALELFMQHTGYQRFATARTTNDCFQEMSGRLPPGTMPRNMELCINPWTDVNISQDGDVVSCCYIFDTNKTEATYYGNLWEQSLEEIWNGPAVAAMRESHMKGLLKDSCTRCYYKSPTLIHQNIVSRLVRSRGHV